MVPSHLKYFLHFLLEEFVLKINCRKIHSFTTKSCIIKFFKNVLYLLFSCFLQIPSFFIRRFHYLLQEKHPLWASLLFFSLCPLCSPFPFFSPLPHIFLLPGLLCFVFIFSLYSRLLFLPPLLPLFSFSP